jgi:GTPase
MKKSKIPIVAIIGRANVGKSSIFNRLAGKRQAIVFDEPGTTRDRVLARANFDGKNCWLVDTAGAKIATDDFELSIQQQIEEATTSAEVIVIVVEAHIGATKEDRDVTKKALKTKKPVVLVLNKLDKAKLVNLEDFKSLGVKEVVNVSAEHNTGIDELKSVIVSHLNDSISEQSNSVVVAIIGRPNVGKSKLFNNLIHQEQAVISAKAGTTRDVNRAQLVHDDQTIELLDTAGIRRAAKTAKNIEYFSSLRTLAAIEESDICVLLIESTEPSTKLDMKIAGMVKVSGKGLILALSKWDLLDADEHTYDKMANQIMHEYQFVNWAPLIITSADEKKNLGKLMSLALNIYVQRKIKIKTSALNTWLLNVTSEHPPAGFKNTHPALKYITQTNTDPPTFGVHGRHLKTLHWSYKRYMERKFREEFKITGTAIKFEFKDKNLEARIKN